MTGESTGNRMNEVVNRRVEAGEQSHEALVGQSKEVRQNALARLITEQILSPEEILEMTRDFQGRRRNGETLITFTQEIRREAASRHPEMDPSVYTGLVCGACISGGAL